MPKLFKKISELYVIHFVSLLVARFRQDRCADMASSLTFTTLLSLVPLITIVLTVFSAFPQFSDFSEHAKNIILQNMLPETGGKMISRYMEQFAENAARLTAVGIVFLAITSMLMIYSIDNAFNTIWRVSRQRTVLQRVLVYWAVLTLAPLLMGGSLSMTSWLIGMSVGNFNHIPTVVVWMLKVVPLLLATLAFAFLFRVVPNRYVPMQHAFIGGAVSAIAFEAMSRAFALYITNFPTYKLVYGAFASIPIFLLWIYLSWLTVLLGALLTASLSHWRSKTGIQPLSPEVKLFYALCILRLMSESMRSGITQTLPKLSRELKLGYDSLEELLEKMATIDLVQRTVGRSWVMIRAPEHVQAIELYRLFVFDPAKPPFSVSCEGINTWLTRLAERNAKNSEVSLRALFNEATISR
ncbi:MAG TPA: YihY family inner membrane protein [Gallionellaceae bacterium]|nr:YihY family inner membrane protein [Gallionellaceae bacterium]